MAGNIIVYYKDKMLTWGITEREKVLPYFIHLRVSVKFCLMSLLEYTKILMDFLL